MNEYKGIMPTKIELTLEQSQQGVSNDVLGRLLSSNQQVKPGSSIKDLASREILSLKILSHNRNRVFHEYANLIPPPTIIPQSSKPDPQEFFLPEELLSPKKQGRNQSFSSTSTLPQVFEMGESSRKTSLERHEEQIEDILNHLDELSLSTVLNT
ncbi:hypothetical protein Tco_0702331 [Tanacetum coccineum]|uniref:Uncharacterized protein n=1 Tax=Tanacetum coccineum TaxID=301880 RepID=A0ABQ4XXE2_9ASTR